MKSAFCKQVKSTIPKKQFYLSFLVSAKREEYTDDDLTIDLQNLFPVLKRLKAHFWSYNIDSCRSYLFAMPINLEQAEELNQNPVKVIL